MSKFFDRFKRKRKDPILPGELRSLLELTVQNNAMCRQILNKHYALEQAFNIKPDGPLNLDSFFGLHEGCSDLIREQAENDILSNAIWSKYFPHLENRFPNGQ